MKRISGLIMAGALLVAGCSREPERTSGPLGPGSPQPEMNAAQKAYDKVNQDMHAAMSILPADPDLAYMQHMKAHHQGAIAMSEVVLKYGKDPKARDLANRVIEAQTAEVAEIQSWLDARGTAPAAADGMGGMTDHSAHAQ